MYSIKNRRPEQLQSTDASAIVCIAFTAARRNSRWQHGGYERFGIGIPYVGLLYHFG